MTGRLCGVGAGFKEIRLEETGDELASVKRCANLGRSGFVMLMTQKEDISLT